MLHFYLSIFFIWHYIAGSNRLQRRRKSSSSELRDILLDFKHFLRDVKTQVRFLYTYTALTQLNFGVLEENRKKSVFLTRKLYS